MWVKSNCFGSIVEIFSLWRFVESAPHAAHYLTSFLKRYRWTMKLEWQIYLSHRDKPTCLGSWQVGWCIESRVKYLCRECTHQGTCEISRFHWILESVPMWKVLSSVKMMNVWCLYWRGVDLMIEKYSNPLSGDKQENYPFVTLCLTTRPTLSCGFKTFVPPFEC